MIGRAADVSAAAIGGPDAGGGVESGRALAVGGADVAVDPGAGTDAGGMGEGGGIQRTELVLADTAKPTLTVAPMGIISAGPFCVQVDPSEE